MLRSIIGCVLLLVPAGIASAQTSVDGALLALKSSGSANGKSWVLSDNGFVGTYVSLPQAGELSIVVHAGGPGAHMNFAVGPLRKGFDLAGDAKDYAFSFNLPAGMHLLRIELTSGKPLTIGRIQLGGGGRFVNENSNANALAAADSYVENFRKGDAMVSIPGVAAGTPVHVKLRRHAFHFGACLSLDDNAKLIDESAPPGSDAAKYQQFVNAHFNTIVAGNAGKWMYNEAEPGKPTMQTVDALLAYGKKHDMGVRMHNLIWSNQQPEWVNDLLKRAKAGDAAAKQELRAAISRRIGYYLRDRAGQYIDVDVLNEGLRNRSYWDIFGPAGIADIHNECAKAAGDALLYPNEYNVFQWSFDEQPGRKSIPDPYANWYRREVEAIRDAGGAVTGIGVQYYADISTSAQKDGPHSEARIAGALENLAVTGLPICLTEFGVQRGQDKTGDPRLAAIALEETLRLAFGTDQVNGFLIWGFRMPWLWNKADVGALLDADWSPTPAGERFLALMGKWTTDLDASADADGAVHFSGFYGDYDVSAGGKSYSFTLTKGQSRYSLK